MVIVEIAPSEPVGRIGIAVCLEVACATPDVIELCSIGITEHKRLITKGLTIVRCKIEGTTRRVDNTEAFGDCLACAAVRTNPDLCCHIFGVDLGRAVVHRKVAPEDDLFNVILREQILRKVAHVTVQYFICSTAYFVGTHMDICVLDNRIVTVEEFVIKLLNEFKRLVVFRVKLEVTTGNRSARYLCKGTRVSRCVDLGDDVDTKLLQFLLHSTVIILRPDVFAVALVNFGINFTFNNEGRITLTAVVVDVEVQGIQLEPGHIFAEFFDVIEREELTGNVDHTAAHFICRVVTSIALGNVRAGFILIKDLHDRNCTVEKTCFGGCFDDDLVAYGNGIAFFAEFVKSLCVVAQNDVTGFTAAACYGKCHADHVFHVDLDTFGKFFCFSRFVNDASAACDLEVARKTVPFTKTGYYVRTSVGAVCFVFTLHFNLNVAVDSRNDVAALDLNDIKDQCYGLVGDRLVDFAVKRDNALFIRAVNDSLVSAVFRNERFYLAVFDGYRVDRSHEDGNFVVFFKGGKSCDLILAVCPGHIAVFEVFVHRFNEGFGVEIFCYHTDCAPRYQERTDGLIFGCFCFVVIGVRELDAVVCPTDKLTRVGAVTNRTDVVAVVDLCGFGKTDKTADRFSTGNAESALIEGVGDLGAVCCTRKTADLVEALDVCFVEAVEDRGIISITDKTANSVGAFDPAAFNTEVLDRTA